MSYFQTAFVICFDGMLSSI